MPEEPSERYEGAGIVNLSWAITGAFTAAAAGAAAVPGTLGRPAAALDLAAFAVGLVTFLWAYAIAVGRSRSVEIGIGGLFFLAGSAPVTVRNRLLGALAVQVVVAVVTASIRPYTVVAFGILVPMAGLGLAGLWGARHGTFPRRAAEAESVAADEQPG